MHCETAKELFNQDPEELKPCLQQAEKKLKERKLNYEFLASDRMAACEARVIHMVLSADVDK